MKTRRHYPFRKIIKYLVPKSDVTARAPFLAIHSHCSACNATHTSFKRSLDQAAWPSPTTLQATGKSCGTAKQSFDVKN
jgi:hypothetical protein